mmetsp:Transcript_10388/g.24619  ORF Transcript_10388/g.24619 Transcript_10388/m.24619 type:complete len:523 (-) Transcript_10388:95-1663(-)
MGSDDFKGKQHQNSFRMGIPFKRGRTIAMATLRTGAAFLVLVSMVTAAFWLILKDPGPSSVWPFQRYCEGRDLLEMAKEKGVQFPKLKLGYVNGRRGVVATSDIAKGEVLVRVPFDALFTYPNAGFGEEKHAGEGVLRKIWREFPTLPEVDRLTIALLYEASLPKSRWDFYVCGVPRPEALGPPVVWEEERVEEACKGSMHALCPWVRLRKAFYADWWVRKQRLVATLQPLFPPHTLTLPNFVWAAAAVNSRMWNMRPTTGASSPSSFRDDGSLVGVAQWVLGPVAELLNHQPRAGHIQWSHTWEMEVVTDKAVPAGEEVFLSYGNKCNLSLLLEYGFALPVNEEWCDERDPDEIERDGPNKQATGEGGERTDTDGDSQKNGATELLGGEKSAGTSKVRLSAQATTQGPAGKGNVKGAMGMEGKARGSAGVAGGASVDRGDSGSEHGLQGGADRPRSKSDHDDPNHQSDHDDPDLHSDHDDPHESDQEHHSDHDNHRAHGGILKRIGKPKIPGGDSSNSEDD